MTVTVAIVALYDTFAKAPWDHCMCRGINFHGGNFCVCQINNKMMKIVTPQDLYYVAELEVTCRE